MKKMQTILIIGTMVFGLALSGAAFAFGPPHSAPGAGHHRHGGNGELGFLVGSVYRNLTVQALSDMTGQTEEAVRQQLRDEGMRAFLTEHKIDRGAFRTAIQAKVKTLVADLVKNGYITPEQQERFVKKAEFRAERHALMSRLVEKGVAEGTITPEQARMLMGGHYK